MSSSSISVDLEPIRQEYISFLKYALEDQTVGVLTSGEGAQGMNAALYAAIRMGLHVGSKMYFIHDGYEGLVKGDQCIVEATWESVSDIIHLGGTLIGTSCCQNFCKEKYYQAAYNLVANNIHNLVVIGGMDCLIKTKEFRQEWPLLVEKLTEEKILVPEKSAYYDTLNIVSIMGSLDNDLCGTDITLGIDSALHRILEIIDSVVSVSSGCNRTLVLEVIGENRGSLALNAGLLCEADFLFIPEWPPRLNWEKVLCEQIKQKRSLGHNLSIVIIAEGAIDRDFKPITPQLIKSVIDKNLMEDVQITTLGHVQNSGKPSAFDRILGIRMGAQAIFALLEATPYTEPLLISLDGNQPVKVSLSDCIGKKQFAVKALKEQQWLHALNLCGRAFKSSLIDFRKLTAFEENHLGKEGYTLAVMNVGVSCCGMNAAVWSFVRSCTFKGNTVLGIHDGFDGLLERNVTVMLWREVSGWIGLGGSLLESKITLPILTMGKVAARFREFGIQALMIIGGFEAYQAVLQMAENRSEYPEFCIPMIVIPASASNNVPGTDFSLGSDSVLNMIVKACDRECYEAEETTGSVHVIEIPGEHCGFLTSMSSLALGADASYIFEKPFSFRTLIEDVFSLQEKIANGSLGGYILRNEMANSNYSTDFIFRLFSEEGKGIFDTKMIALGPLLQGIPPSALDRLMGIRMSAKGAEWLMNSLQTISDYPENRSSKLLSCNNPNTAVVLGLVKRRYTFTPVQSLKGETDFKHKIPRKQWWIKLRTMIKAFASQSF